MKHRPIDSPYAAVWDLEGLKARSIIDTETGCWKVQAARYSGSTSLWVPQVGKVLTLTAAFAWLMTGKAAARGTMWVAVCGNTGCGNPAHRKLGDRSLLMRVMRPTLDPAHRAKIQRAHLKRSPAYSPEMRAEIMASQDTIAETARRLGIHRSVVSKVRMGGRWQAAAPGSSVFNLAGAA